MPWLVLTLHSSLAVGHGVELGQQLKKKENFCCGTLGNGRAISDAARTQNRGRSAAAARRFSRPNLPQYQTRLSRLLSVDTIDGPNNRGKLSRPRSNNDYC